MFAELELNVGNIVSPERITRELKKSGNNGRVPRMKPFYIFRHADPYLFIMRIAKNGLNLLKPHEQKDFDFWSRALFTDEGK